MSRLSIDLTEQQHRQIKAVAALQGKSIKEYAVERLLPLTADEEASMQELKALLLERIADAERRNISTKSITDIVEEALRAPGAV